MKYAWIICFIAPLLLCAEPRKLCLALPVEEQNEEKVLICLESVKNIVDCVSIIDMGISDKARNSIELFSQKNKIPLHISKQEALPYTKRKQIALNRAKISIEQFGFPLSASYILFLEPTQILSDQSTISLETLTENSYLVLEKSQSLSFCSYTPNLFLASENTPPQVKLKTVRIEELSSEKGKTDKEKETFKQKNHEKTIALFTLAIREDPENERCWLYLAQAYKTASQFKDAINWYNKRIERGGDPQELWFAKYMIGECLEGMGKWSEALTAYLNAYQFNPDRGEPIHKVANYFRTNGENNLAYLFANHGLIVPHFDTNILFPLTPLYDYQFDEEISIAAFYTRFKEEGSFSANNVLLRKTTPDWIKLQGYRNILFYTKHLNATRQQILIPLPPIVGDETKNYNPMNPSIVKTETGYKLICRAVNYTQVGAKHFYTPDPDWIFRTKNFLVHYDKAFNRLSQHEIIEDLPRQKFNAFSVVGLEDCRIIDRNQTEWFTCTTLDTNPTGAIQVSLGQIDEIKGPSGTAVKVKKLIPLQGPDPHRCEKNWLPFLHNNELHIVYQSDPFTLFKPNVETGKCETVLTYTPEHDFSQFRGSAAPIPFDEGYLMLVHEVALLNDYSRVYLHRFVFLDENFTIKTLSKPFTFLHQGVEFCLSMTVDHSGKNLIMPIGIEDKEAWLLTVDLQEIRSMLILLPPIYPPLL